MEFRNLITFLKVAELNSFSHAAEKLGYSQSAITIQIQQLEKELSVKLFERLNKGVTLTREGIQFQFYANEILRLSNEAASDIRQHGLDSDPTSITGSLRIGSIESISTSLLPKILTKFHQIYPYVNVSVHTKHRDTLINDTINNSIDLFFTFEEKRVISNLERIYLSQAPIVFVASATHPCLQTSETLSLEKLCQFPFILTEKKESYRNELDKLLSQNDLEINPVMELSNTETIMHLVEENVGLSFVPLFSATPFIQNNTVSLVSVDIPLLKMQLQMFYHKKKWISPQMSAFFKVTEDFCNSMFF